MKRSKKHIVKQERPETSTSQQSAIQKEHDLAYYIHDRVELMHQVFSVLKPKELRAMAPECVRHISVSDLQELCMEELLGISSKRLCAILDGASPPSDTDSSSESELLETISLDSISSDEEILSQVSYKKSKKHKHHSKSKLKKRKSKDKGDRDKDQADRSRRAGLTVLELLELQARARAIRAQLQQEQASAVTAGGPSESAAGTSSDNEVEIKEEAAEVVEISSEDEKPNVQELEERMVTPRKETTSVTPLNSKTVTKKVNDLVITVPKTKTSRKIKLKRNTSSNSKVAVKATEKDKDSNKTDCRDSIVDITSETNAKTKRPERVIHIASSNSDAKVAESLHAKKLESNKEHMASSKGKGKSRDKKKKKRKDKTKNKDGSDHDEITLQLSDTEKMDLLEDLEGKKSEKCSDTEDSSNDSSDEDSIEDDDGEDKNLKSNDLVNHTIDFVKDLTTRKNSKETGSDNVSMSIEESFSNEKDMSEVKSSENKTPLVLEDSLHSEDNQVSRVDKATIIEISDEAVLSDVDKGNLTISIDDSEKLQTEECTLNLKENEPKSVSKEFNLSPDSKKCDAVDLCLTNDTPLIALEVDKISNVNSSIQDIKNNEEQKTVNSEIQSKKVDEDVNNDNISKKVNDTLSITVKVLEPATDESELVTNSEIVFINKVCNDESHVETSNIEGSKEKSDGEISDRDSSEVEVSDFKQDVVYITDDEKQNIDKKKKKKKDKKSKKEKKCKKKKDFRESADQNFYTETNKNISKEQEKEVIVNSERKIYSSISKCDSMITENVKDKVVNILPETRNLEKVKFGETDLNDEVYEILELSDDSSCYEVEDIFISKEPTTEEIEALSAKLDEIERDRPVDSNTMDDKEDNDDEDLDKVSWKDRYLQSTKVKKVLTTANILNAMKKKNLALKKKLQESKKETVIEKEIIKNVKIARNVFEDESNVKKANDMFEDGSIEQYNALETSTKYVDPVKEVTENATARVTDIESGSTDKIVDGNTGAGGNEKIEKNTVSKEMTREAKQLLKMYKRLLKYNDMSKQKDASKKKKNKKKKKSKDKDKSVSEVAAAI